jgi:hypothetical protein
MELAAEDAGPARALAGTLASRAAASYSLADYVAFGIARQPAPALSLTEGAQAVQRLSRAVVPLPLEPGVMPAFFLDMHGVRALPVPAPPGVSPVFAAAAEELWLPGAAGRRFAPELGPADLEGLAAGAAGVDEFQGLLAAAADESLPPTLLERGRAELLAVSRTTDRPVWLLDMEERKLFVIGADRAPPGNAPLRLATRLGPDGVLRYSRLVEIAH